MANMLYPLLALLAPLVSYLMFNYIDVFRSYLKITPLNIENCKSVGAEYPGIREFARYNSNIFLGVSDDRIKILNQTNGLNSTAHGNIIAYFSDTNKVEKVAIEQYPSNLIFHPDSLYISNNTLYVVNHSYRQGERVESFEIKTEGNKVKLLFTKGFELGEKFNGMISDLVALGYGKFYFSIVKPSPDSAEGPTVSRFTDFFKMITTVLGIRRSYIMYCNGELETENYSKCVEVSGSRSYMITGLAYDELHHILYSADSVGGRIKSFQRVNETLTPIEDGTIELKMNPDKIQYDSNTNKLYIGGAKMVKDVIHFFTGVKYEDKKPNEMSFYSGAVEYDLTKRNMTQELFMANKTNGFITSAFKLDDRVIMGNYYDGGILSCQLKNS
jgi:hypothetical protein